jgi:hypothetical protein
MIPMLSLWQWLVLAAVPPAIAALYFLRLRRRPIEVPSTYLWKKTIEDLHVNSLWQRLRKNILLLLQLLLVLLAIIALLRPGWSGAEMTGSRFVFLVDNSASMSATDVEPTRLDEAKLRVRELIEAMEEGDEAMIISFSNFAQTVQSFTGDRRALLQRLEGIQPTARTTSLDEALQAAAGLANPGASGFEMGDVSVAEAQPARLFIFSDGRFPDVENFSLGNLYPSEEQKPVFVPIGYGDTSNLAITIFSTRRNENSPESIEPFARLENHGAEPAKVEASLFVDDELFRAREVSLPAGKATSVVFDALEQIGSAALRLEIKTDDALAIDDKAWAVVNPPTRARVLYVTVGNRNLEICLTTTRAQRIADVTIIAPDQLKRYQESINEGAYELVIYEDAGPLPEKSAPDEDGNTKPTYRMPQANTLFIGRLPPIDTWKAEPAVGGPQIIDLNRAHPIMKILDMGDVAVAEAKPLKVPPGGTTLIDSSAGPLFVIAPRGGYEDAVLAFSLQEARDGETLLNTDWPIRTSFPLFVKNMLEYLGGAQEDATGTGYRVGDVVTPRGVEAVDRLTVTMPSGEQIEIGRTSLGTFHFTGTDEVGVYRLGHEGRSYGRFAVNLFSSAESRIQPRQDDPIKIGHVEVEGASLWRRGRKELWKWLLLAALGLLLLEWYVYNRRVYI